MTIPKIIHQIWIGDQSKKPSKIMDMWKEMHPDFEYICWNEKLIEEKLTINKRYKFKLDNHEAIWGKADMYRWLILRNYGGIFIDADIVPIEKIDDELLKKSFVCYEQETHRQGLLATSIQAYVPKHPIPCTAIDWIMDNNVNEKKTRTESWILVGPGLLTRTYETLKKNGINNCIDIKPSHLFLPDHHTGYKYSGHSKIYGTHEWGSTKSSYDKISKMNIPEHFIKPSKRNYIDIDLTNIKPKELNNCLESIKEIKGRFNINIHYDKDDEYRKIIRDWAFNTRWITIISTIKGEVSGTEI